MAKTARKTDTPPVEEAQVAPQPALLPPPPEVATASQAVQTDNFLLRGGLVDAWFLRRSDVLLVTFDNLSSVGEYDPPQPWLQVRAANMGLSILGILASRKDWYRNDDTPALISALRDAGLFAQFRRVVFVGASMGGYAALAYSALVPGSVVLTFSPQTSLSRKIARFEQRYRYGSRKWDWTTPAFLDAATSAPVASEVYVVFDPFIAEDRAHADRITGPGVVLIKAGHMGHRAIRQLKSAGVLQGLIETVAQGNFNPLTYWAAYRARRGVQSWQKSLLEEAANRRHPRLGLRAAQTLLHEQPDSRSLRRAVAEFGAAMAKPVLPKIVPQTITVTEGAPSGPFAGTILHLPQAFVIPERDNDAKFATGVLTSDGSWCALSQVWIRARQSTRAPTLQPGEPIEELPGRHLFAGHFRPHFGHFLVECTARLWAIDHVPAVDSILYIPYRGDPSRGVVSHQDIFRLLGIEAPVRIWPGAVRVEDLVVPELGFGWGDRYAGSPAYRAFMQGRLAHVAPEGSERLYISRAKLLAKRGGVLGESVIETAMERAGFEVFYPELHPVAVQIARYKAARQIVGLDGSALHLAGFVVRPETKVTMILRRSRANISGYRLQFQGFAGIALTGIDAVRTDWVSGEADRVDYQSVGELDFAHLFDRLRALGHLPQNLHPDIPTQPEITAMLDALAARRSKQFRALTPGERHPDEEP